MENKYLDIRIDDTLYWADMKLVCKKITSCNAYPLIFEDIDGNLISFTKSGGIYVNRPPVLSFTKYSIEKGGATFERPKKPLISIDVSKLQKVRFKDYDEEKWLYGWYLATVCHPHPYSVMFEDKTVANFQICEPYEWKQEEIQEMDWY